MVCASRKARCFPAINELNAGLVTFRDELLADSLALKRVELGIVTFGPVLCSGLPWAYGRALARAPCSDLGERWSRGRVDEAVAKPEPPMLLALSHPHDDLSIKVLGARIMVWPMDRPCRRRVLTDAGVDARVRVRLGLAT